MHAAKRMRRLPATRRPRRSAGDRSSEAAQHAAEERRRQEAEAARRAEDQERGKKAEIESRERAAAERQRLEAEARIRAEAERAFTVAKRAGTFLAYDAFLSIHPTSAFADEAQKLKAVLLARDEAYHRASASHDPAVIKSFLATYKKGADVDQLRVRLALLEPQKTWPPTSPAILIPGALAAVLVVGIAVWFAARPSANSQQSSVASMPPPVAPSVVVAPAVQPAPSAPPVANAAPAATLPAPAMPAPAPPAAAPALKSDEISWSLLKDTTDATALQRFVTEFPDSPLRKDAEARVATLEAAQKPATVSAPDPHELARALQFELTRVGCFNGTVNGQFDDDT